MAIRVPDLPFPQGGATSKLAWFGATLLLATPSNLDSMKNDSAQVNTFLDKAGITGGLKKDLSDFIQAVANDPVLTAQMADLHQSLLNSPATRAVYDQTICPDAAAATEILKRMAQPFSV